jgi:Protein phosphatase 2C
MTHDWVVVADSQIGSVHTRDGSRTQDCHRIWTDGSCAVIAVADGHGYFEHFRSHVGSDLATSAAMETLAREVSGFRDAQAVEKQLASEIGPTIVDTWTRTVLEHIDQHPFTSDEQLDVLNDTTVGLLRPYGSTVIAMAVSQEVLAIVQIGDGDAVIIADTGRIAKPLPPDVELDGVRTTSLCQPDPLRSLRCAGLDIAAERIALGFICSDGFSTPRTDAGGWWRQVGEELLDRARNHGFDYIKDKLPLWLDEPARFGGDDTTLAIVGDGQLLNSAQPLDQPSGDALA